MRTIQHAFLLNALLVLLAPLLQSPDAQAAPITFVHEGTGSGTLNGVPFPSSSLVITAWGYTEDREAFSGGSWGYWIDHLGANISIAGIGDLVVLTATRTFVNNTLTRVGFSRTGISGLDLFNGPVDPSFAPWDMLTGTGPIDGAGELMSWGVEPQIITTGGLLIFDDAMSNVTFIAVVPEPPMLALLGLAALVGSVSKQHRSS